MTRKMTSDYCSDHCVFTIYQKTLKIQSILRFDLVTSICRVRYSVTFLKAFTFWTIHIEHNGCCACGLVIYLHALFHNFLALLLAYQADVLLARHTILPN